MISRIILPFCFLFLISCKGSVDYYKPVEVRPEAFIGIDSTNTVFIFSVPEEPAHHPAGAIVEDKGDILKIYLVKALENSTAAKVDIAARLVKDDTLLMSIGYKPTSYFVTLPTRGRGFRICNQGGCGDLNTKVEDVKLEN